jgi:hypothetical protein
VIDESARAASSVDETSTTNAVVPAVAASKGDVTLSEDDDVKKPPTPGAEVKDENKPVNTGPQVKVLSRILRNLTPNPTLTRSLRS